MLHIVYVPVCVFLILVVLLQTGKRADLAGAFGGGGSQTAFGARGAATLLAKVTTASAVLFMIIALALSIMSSRQGTGGGTVLDEVPAAEQAPVEQPVIPAESPTDLPETSPADETTAPAQDTSAEGTEEVAEPGTDDAPADDQP